MPVVELAGVTKAYESKIAVNNLSLSIDAGQMFGLLGPNGAGKTSSIRMMMGITIPDSGPIRLFDKPFDRKSLERVGYLPEERGLYKKMKVLDQLVFFGELHGLSAGEARKRAIDWAKRMEIAESLLKKTEELSKGMQQKIQFISCLLHDPGLIIMDEPFSGLDPVNAVLLEKTLIELKESGQSHRLLHPSHGPGRKALRLHLPHQSTDAPSSPAKYAKSNPATRAIASSSSSKAAPTSSRALKSPKPTTSPATLKSRLKPDGDAQKLLHQAAAGATIYRFEMVEPSLEEIFIKTVGGKADA